MRNAAPQKPITNQRPKNPNNVNAKNANIKRQSGTKTNTPPPAKKNPNLRNQNNSKINEQARKKQAEYAARMAAQRRIYQMEKKRRRKIMLTAFLYRFILFIIILALLLSSFVLIMHVTLNKTDKSGENDFTYYLGNRKKQTVLYNEMMRNGEMYVNFSDVAKEFELAVSGSFGNMKFTPNTSDEYIRFKKDDYIAYINGVPVRMKQKAILVGKDMWIPLDFFTEYTDGITVTYDKETNKLTLKRITFKTGYKDITFKLKPSSPIASIEEPLDFGDTADTKQN